MQLTTQNPIAPPPQAPLTLARDNETIATSKCEATGRRRFGSNRQRHLSAECLSHEIACS